MELPEEGKKKKDRRELRGSSASDAAEGSGGRWAQMGLLNPITHRLSVIVPRTVHGEAVSHTGKQSGMQPGLYPSGCEGK